ncbi:MAG: hypothetical protein GY758_16400, partial [Fuerstiella sp.]|nr:hypothetical protein [Fuerstiella sp.]
MLSDRRGREYVRSLWVTVVAAVGLVLGLVVAPAATASSTADAAGSEASSAAADGANTNSVSGASGAAADPVAYINAQNTGAVTQISAGGDAPGHTCAVTDVGAAYCWGKNDYGQLGNGLWDINDGSLVPVRVKAGEQPGDEFLSGVRQISAGGQHTCAVTVDGTVYCWGENLD